MREDFKKKVTLALKKAAESWRVGEEVAGKRHPSRGRSRGKRGAGRVGRRGLGAGSASGRRVQRAAHAALRSLGPGLQ